MTKPQTWGGRTAEQRRAERRERLIEAAIEIWGESGWAAVTMRGVCARARLIDRYFYESFADRDVLLAVVWDQVRDETTAALTEAVAGEPEAPLAKLRRAAETVVNGVAADPRRAQILFGEHGGSAVLEQRRQRLLIEMTDVFVTFGQVHLRPEITVDDFRKSTLMAVGGFLELITAWHSGLIDIDAAGIVEQVVHFGAILGLYYLPAPTV